MLLSTTSLGTTSSLPASRRLRNTLMARRRWVRPASRRSQSEAATMRDPIRRMGLVALFYAERVLLVEQETVRLAQLLLPPLGACAPQLVEDRLVDPTQSSFWKEDLVCARECALEPHRTGIILALWRGTLYRANGPRPRETDSGRGYGHEDTKRGSRRCSRTRVAPEAAWRLDLLRRRTTSRDRRGLRRSPWRGREHLRRRAWHGLRSPWLLPRLQKARDRDGLPLRCRHPLRAGRQPGPCKLVSISARFGLWALACQPISQALRRLTS